ncbi:MAG: hypothetical protein JNL67_02060 [Planctomycetaceae bacterium]|nr:hypothetical protein [Planctomycetaceae bacterium]
MTQRIPFISVWLALIGSLAATMCGCAARSVMPELLTSFRSSPTSTPVTSEYSHGTDAATPYSLPSVPYEQRPATLLADASAPLLGRVVADTLPERVRSISLAECESQARDTAPIGVQLQRHAQWLAAHGQQTLSDALKEQARFESDKHRLLASEAYLNLANVYAQTTVADQGLTFVGDLRESIAEFRRAGIEVAVNSNELDRQELAIQESVVELHYNQTRLNRGLEALLQVPPDPTPIWAYVENESTNSVVDEMAATEFALQHRGDLKSLQILANDAESIPADTLQQLHPLLATGIPIPTVSWWMCLAKREAECLEKSQTQQRRRLFEAMVAAKIEQIRAEVADRCLAIQRVESLLELKIQQRTLLREAQQNSNKTGQGQLDVKAYIADSQQDLKLTSEIISLMFDQQIERARLQHTMGNMAAHP